MATTIYANGTAKVVVPDTQKLTVFSNSKVTISQLAGYPNEPAKLVPITVTQPGDTYLSGAVTGATTFVVEASAAPAYYATGAAPSVSTPQSDITAADATFTIVGLAGAQGGYVTTTGGTSSTSANAGGVASLVGGTPGATGVGGVASVTGGIGGATSGAGGAASLVGGAGTAGNAAGGNSNHVGGAGQGSAAGGAAQTVGGLAGATGIGGAATVTGGAGGATSGAGGAAIITGGAATAGVTNGGSVVLVKGAKSSTGIDGGVISRGQVFKTQPTPTAKTTAVTLTIAELVTGIITATHTAGATQAYTLPTGTLINAGVPTMAGDDSFDWVLVNLSAAAIDTVTVTAATDHTIVGNPIVQSAHSTTGGITGNSTQWRTRFVSGVTWVSYRIA